MQQRIGDTTIELVLGDITRQDTDAIVNAANSSLMGGGGVDGAIHRAGGPAILEECRKVRDRQGSLATGRAVITTAGKMKARHVIHTVGPVWRGGDQGEPELLASCYRSCLELVRLHRLESVAFPSVSTGVYGYPVRMAAPVALDAVGAELVRDPECVTLVRFVLFDEMTLAAYAEVLVDLTTLVG